MKKQKLSWLELFQYVHMLKLIIEDEDFTQDFYAFATKAIELIEQGLLSIFDDIIPQVGEEFNPVFHEQIGYVQNSRISKVFSYGKIKDGIVIFKAKVKR